MRPLETTVEPSTSDQTSLSIIYTEYDAYAGCVANDWIERECVTAGPVAIEEERVDTSSCPCQVWIG